MFCRNCGNEVADQAVICLKCGSAPRNGIFFCQSCGAGTNLNAEICVKCGVRLVRIIEKPITDGVYSQTAAGLLGIFLGGFGVHRFYLGFVGIGVAQIIVTVLTCGVGSIWGLIEGILILTGSINQDAHGRPLKP